MAITPITETEYEEFLRNKYRAGEESLERVMLENIKNNREDLETVKENYKAYVKNAKAKIQVLESERKQFAGLAMRETQIPRSVLCKVVGVSLRTLKTWKKELDNEENAQ